MWLHPFAEESSEKPEKGPITRRGITVPEPDPCPDGVRPNLPYPGAVRIAGSRQAEIAPTLAKKRSLPAHSGHIHPSGKLETEGRHHEGALGCHHHGPRIRTTTPQTAAGLCDLSRQGPRQRLLGCAPPTRQRSAESPFLPPSQGTQLGPGPPARQGSQLGKVPSPALPSIWHALRPLRCRELGVSGKNRERIAVLPGQFVLCGAWPPYLPSRIR